VSKSRGVLVFVLLLTLLGSAVLFAALSLRSPASRPAAHAVLVWEVPARLDESPPAYKSLSLEAIRLGRALTLWDVVSAIDRAAADEHVEALVLHIDGVSWGWGKLIEVRDALQRFRAAGKPVYASLSAGGDMEYFLASAADVVSAPPTVTLRVDGLTLSAMFYRGALDKLGVVPNFRQVGEFKSGAEPWTRPGFSDAARANYDDILDDRFGLLVDSLASARGLPADSVRALLDAGPHLARTAHDTGLLDTLLYVAETDTLATRGSGRRRATLDFDRYAQRGTGSVGGPRIALVHASGTIAPGRSRPSPGDDPVMGAETMVEALRDLRRRSSIRAVVLRVDSPGGDAQASDDIWREVERLAATRPVVVSMSDVAASGGYYIAAAGSRIVAQPTTLTGSIGIYGGKFNVSGLLDKIGIGVESLSRGRRAEMLSPFRDFTAEEAELYDHQLEDFYGGFLDRVARNRGRSATSIDSVARGRVWSGRSALAVGLVDTLGGIDVALAEARRAAGIDADAPVTIERWPTVERSFLQQLIEGLVDEEELASIGIPEALPEAFRVLASASVLSSGRALAWLPIAIDIR
jgi:protease-4